MQTDRWRFPVWLLYALLCIFWWGLWGFLSKIGSVAASPLQMQILFTLGMLPVALGMLFQMRWKLDRNRGGITYGLLSGIATGLARLVTTLHCESRTLPWSLRSPECFLCLRWYWRL